MVGVLSIRIKKKPESLIVSNWPLNFESWNHKISVLKGSLQSILCIFGINKAYISVTIFMSSGLLASTCIIPIIGHAQILKPGNSLFTVVTQDLQVQLLSLCISLSLY